MADKEIHGFSGEGVVLERVYYDKTIVISIELINYTIKIDHNIFCIDKVASTYLSSLCEGNSLSSSVLKTNVHKKQY